MKTLLIPVLLFCFPMFCQSQAIPKSYNYFSQKEEWKLKVFDFKTFELHVMSKNDSYFFLLDGTCILTDSTIALAFNSSPNLDVLKRDTGYGPNIKEFIKGSAFKRVNDYIIPKISAGYNKMQAQDRQGIYGSFYEQVELFMGGTKIQFESKKRYILTETFCTGKFIEKGRYIQSGNLVTLKPNNKNGGRSSVLMDNAVVFATEDLLISRKVQPSMQPDRFAKEEVFLYFHRL